MHCLGCVLCTNVNNAEGKVAVKAVKEINSNEIYTFIITYPNVPAIIPLMKPYRPHEMEPNWITVQPCEIIVSAEVITSWRGRTSQETISYLPLHHFSIYEIVLHYDRFLSHWTLPQQTSMRRNRSITPHPGHPGEPWTSQPSPRCGVARDRAREKKCLTVNLCVAFFVFFFAGRRSFCLTVWCVKKKKQNNKKKKINSRRRYLKAKKILTRWFIRFFSLFSWLFLPLFFYAAHFGWICEECSVP